MARLHRTPSYTGTRNGICVYQLFGRFYMRTKSSLSAERVKTAPEFEQTRLHSSLLARASKIGSQVYRTLSKSKKKKFTSQFLTGKVMKMLKNGMQENDIIEVLQKGC